MLDVITAEWKELAGFIKLNILTPFLPSTSFSGTYPRETKTYV